jgi:5-methylcytosine-specific restriction enzyme A
MPIAPGRPCRHRGCVAVTRDQSGYCPQHKPKYYDQFKRKDYVRPSARERGYDDNWAAFRRMYLRRHPLCDKCPSPSFIPHHIIPLAHGGAKYDENNLQPLCLSCHNKEHIHKRGKAKHEIQNY